MENSTCRVNKLTKMAECVTIMECPRVPEGMLGFCLEMCNSLNDDSCTIDEKCCSNGCGHVCQSISYKFYPLFKYNCFNL
jgi:hypothetical protein